MHDISVWSLQVVFGHWFGADALASCAISFCICSKEQSSAIVSARAGLLAELQRVAADWQRVLPTLALQLLQVPRAQWHTVGAVQAMVTNLAAEREAVVGFLHTLIDEVGGAASVCRSPSTLSQLTHAAV